MYLQLCEDVPVPVVVVDNARRHQEQLFRAVVDLNRKEDDNAGGHQEQLLGAVVDLNRKEEDNTGGHRKRLHARGCHRSK